MRDEAADAVVELVLARCTEELPVVLGEEDRLYILGEEDRLYILGEDDLGISDDEGVLDVGDPGDPGVPGRESLLDTRNGRLTVELLPSLRLSLSVTTLMPTWLSLVAGMKSVVAPFFSLIDILDG